VCNAELVRDRARATPGSGDCNNAKIDGCETSLTTATNCGACGTACSLPNAASSCASGTCSLVSCNGGFFNCDSNSGNGCEALPCANGQACQHGSDCVSGVCQNGFCASPSCSDGVQNGSETSTDCGGGSCPPCGDGLGCGNGSDCINGVCLGNLCQPASCTDGVKKQRRDGRRLRRPALLALRGRHRCAIAGDCQSGVCVGGRLPEPGLQRTA